MSLKSLTLPNTPIEIIGGSAMRNGLRFVRISQNANISKTAPFTYTEIEEFDFIAKSTASNGFFRECKNLKKVKNIQGCVIYSNFFVGCYSLEEVEIPKDQTIIYANSFTNCYTLRELIFPKGITTIQASAFPGSGIGKFDFSALEAVPTLENGNAFGSIHSKFKIIVPDALYDDWKAATNWSTYADRIVKASEYNG